MTQVKLTQKEADFLKGAGKKIGWVVAAFLGFFVFFIIFIKTEDAGVFSALYGLLIIIFCVLLYILPELIAQRRNHLQRNAIWLLDILLGWTVLGWIIALIWSASATSAKASGT